MFITKMRRNDFVVELDNGVCYVNLYKEVCAN